MKKTLVLLSAIFLSVQVQAAVINGGNILPSNTILLDTGLENAAQEAFNEKQGVLLASDLTVNGGMIAAGTRVDSHVVFYNTVGSVATTDTQTWTFSGQILGVMVDEGGVQMAASDPLFANGAYFTDRGGSGFALQGLELGPNGGDSFSFSGNMLNLTTLVAEPGDWIRVITASPVPLPAAIWLFGFAIFGLMGIRRQAEL